MRACQLRSIGPKPLTVGRPASLPVHRRNTVLENRRCGLWRRVWDRVPDNPVIPEVIKGRAHGRRRQPDDGHSKHESDHLIAHDDRNSGRDTGYSFDKERNRDGGDHQDHHADPDIHPAPGRNATVDRLWCRKVKHGGSKLRK